MRRRVVVVAGSAAAALLVVGTVTGLALRQPDGTSATKTAPVPPPFTTAESACGLRGSDGTQGAVDASWEDVAGWALPISATDGPGMRDPRGAWSCYTRTESGAVLAAYIIAMRGGGLADDWQTVVREQTMPGPGQETLLGSVPNFSSVTTPRGFDIAGYTDDRATVRYRLLVNGGEYACTIDVQWSRDDWRLVLGNDGSTSSGCSREIPAEFTPWGP